VSLAIAAPGAKNNHNINIRMKLPYHLYKVGFNLRRIVHLLKARIGRCHEIVPLNPAERHFLARRGVRLFARAASWPNDEKKCYDVKGETIHRLLVPRVFFQT
jgi:hypothetical protein